MVCPGFAGVPRQFPQRTCFCHPWKWVMPQEAGFCRLHCPMMVSKHHAPDINQASHLPSHLLSTIHSAFSKIVPLAAK